MAALLRCVRPVVRHEIAAAPHFAALHASDCRHVAAALMLLPARYPYLDVDVDVRGLLFAEATRLQEAADAVQAAAVNAQAEQVRVLGNWC
jgi:hypothetical protein